MNAAYTGLTLTVELLLLLGFKALLDVVFVFYIYPGYSYEPYHGLYGELEPSRLILGYLVIPVLWFWLRSVLSSPKFPVSRMLLTVMFIFVVVPAFTVQAQTERPFIHLIWILMGFVVLGLVLKYFPLVKVSSPPKELTFLLSLAGLFVIIYTFAMLVLTGGVNRINFSLFEVYDFREQYLSSQFPLSNYVVPWTAYVLNMTFFVWAFFRRKLVLAGLFVGLQVLLFAMTSFKAFLYLPFIALVLLMVLPYIAFPRLALLGGVGVLGMLWLLSQLGQPLGLGTADRAFFLPAATKSLYFDYFSVHPLGLMSGSPWVGLLSIETPYPVSSINLIAQEYWGRDFSPNVGWIGSAFAEFGVLGILLFAVILGIYIRLADSIAFPLRGRGVTEAVFLGPVLAFANSSLTTSLMTMGGFLALLALWVLGRELNRTRLSPRRRHRPSMLNQAVPRSE